MEFLSSSKFDHADELSSLIPKQAKPFEDTVIVSLRTEQEVKNNLCNTFRKLPV